MEKIQEISKAKPIISKSTFVESDINVFLELSRAEFIKNDPTWKDEYVESLLMSPKHVAWKHLNSSFGASTFVKLNLDNEVIGRVLMQPRQFQTIHSKYTAACDMDMLVVKSHRMPPSNFIGLIKSSHQTENFDLIYHTANEITHILYGKLLGFPNPFSLIAVGLPIRISGILNNFLGLRFKIVDIFFAPIQLAVVLFSGALSLACGIVIEEGNLADLELEELFNACLIESGSMLARDNAFLNWRFGSQSDLSGKIFRLKKKGILMGYTVTRKVQLGKMSQLALMDFLIRSELSILERIYLKCWFLRRGIKESVDVVIIFLNPLNKMSKNFMGFPLFKIPNQVLPHETPIFIKTNNPALKEYEHIRSTHMTLADLDYF